MYIIIYIRKIEYKAKVSYVFINLSDLFLERNCFFMLKGQKLRFFCFYEGCYYEYCELNKFLGYDIILLLCVLWERSGLSGFFYERHKILSKGQIIFMEEKTTITTKEDKTTELFKNAPVPKAVILNAIPSIISMLMVLVYNLADIFFIGQTQNTSMVAAVTVATPIFMMFMSVGMLFGIGGTSLISRRIGGGHAEDAKHISAFCFWADVVFGVIGAAGVIIFAAPLSSLIGGNADTNEYIIQYLTIVAFGIPFLILSNSFSNIIRAEGKPTTAMLGMIIGNMMNVVLDPLMISVFKWNVAGAAFATVLGNVFSTLFYTVHLIKSPVLSISPKSVRFGNGIAKGVLLIGIPASLNGLLINISNILVNSQMGTYGTVAQAGLGIAIKVNMIVVMLLIGLGLGIQPLLGYCFGAGNKKRYYAVLKFSIFLALSISFVMTLICFFGASPLVKAFLDKPDAYEYSMKFARIYIISGPVMGILFVFINAIQSMGAALPALILNISRQGLIYIPVLFIFKAVFNTPDMLAAAQPFTDYCASALAVFLFIIFNKKYFEQNIKLHSVEEKPEAVKNETE